MTALAPHPPTYRGELPHRAVRSLAEMKEVKRAARNAPGITEVVILLGITSAYAAD